MGHNIEKDEAYMWATMVEYIEKEAEAVTSVAGGFLKRKGQTLADYLHFIRVLVYQAFYNRCEIIPGVYFRVPYDTPNYTPLVCRNFKFDTCKFTKVILPVKYIIYAFKSYS